MKKYTAVSFNDVYAVRTIGPCGDLHVIGDVKKFATFEEADRVARDMANGEYGYEKGEYVSMR
jgi:hypothetical protein